MNSGHLRRRGGAALGCAVLTAVTFLLYRSFPDNPIFFDSSRALSEETLEITRANLSWTDLRSLTHMTFFAGLDWFGRDWFRHHLFNLILHAANACLLFAFCDGLFRATVPKTDPDSLSPRAAALGAALLFAVHPVAVYATAYLIQRLTLLALFFGLISLLTFLRAVETRRVIWQIAAAAAYFAAVHAKEHAVTLPAVMAALAVLLRRPARREILPLLREFAPAASLCLAVAVDISIRQSQVVGTAYEPNAASLLKTASADLSGLRDKNLYILSVLSQSWLFFRYLFLWIVPDVRRMAIDLQVAFPQSYFSVPEILGPILYAAYGFLAFRLLAKGSRAGLAGFGMVFPWLMFGTEFATVRLSEQFVLYRSYLWMPGLFCALPAVLDFIPPFPRRRTIAAALILLAAASGASLTRERLSTFESEVALWRDALAKNEGRPEVGYKMARLYFNLGLALRQSGRTDEAIGFYEKCLAVDGDHVLAHIDLVFVHLERGEAASAEKHAREVLRVDPDYADGHYLLGNALKLAKKLPEAVSAYREAVRLDPATVRFRSALGAALMESEKLKEAWGEFEAILKILPGHVPTYVNMGNLLSRLGKYDEALEYYRAVLEQKPGNADARFNAAMALIKKGEPGKAIPHLEAVPPEHAAYGRAREILKKLNHHPGP